DPELFRRLARRLHAATLGLRGPRILSDRPYAPGSLVHYRYGVFGGVRTTTNDGDTVRQEGSRPYERAMNPSTAVQLQRMMVDVVESGTGANAGAGGAGGAGGDGGAGGGDAGQGGGGLIPQLGSGRRE
ncbi:hypothetical protein PV620_17525, partial [Streptomyces sp. ME02-6978a]|nr:hypothetical protein [Streptomyces sp. ME02-6978a]